MADDLNFGINVTASGADIVESIRAKLAAVRAELTASMQTSATFTRTKEQEEAAWRRAGGSIAAYNDQLSRDVEASRVASARQLTEALDAASTAYANMAANIDTSSAEAVDAFKREGLALQDYMEKLGATEGELGRLSATMTQVDARSKGVAILPGAANAVQPIRSLTQTMEEAEVEAYKMNAAMEQADNTITRVPVGARRGASAISSLAFAASTGSGSAKMMALAMGGAVQGIAQLTSSAQLAASATGIGAIITVLATMAILLDRDTDAADKTTKAIHDLGKLNSEQQNLLLAGLDAQIEKQMQLTGFRTQEADAMKKFMSQDFGQQMSGLAQLTFGKGQEDAQKKLEDLLKRRQEIATALIETTGKEENAITEIVRKANEDRLELETTRTKGAMAARIAAADFELAERRREIDKMAATETERGQLVADAVAARNEKVRAIEEAEAVRLEKQRRGWADEALSSFQKRTLDEFTAERLAVERKFEERQKDIKSQHLSDAEITTQTLAAAAARSQALLDIDKAQHDKQQAERVDVEDKLLALTGRTADARAGRIRESYRKMLEDMAKRSDDAGIANVNHLINVEIAAGRMQDLQQVITEHTTELQTKLSEIQALSSVHAISERDARQQTLDIYIKTRDVLAQSLPLLQAQAEAIGSPAALASVEAARLKLLELNVTIQQLADDLFKLKEAGRDSLQQGLTLFIDEAATGAKSLSEVWKDAARSIVDSLRKVAAQMLANLIIQKSLELLGGFSGGGSVGAGVEIAGDGGGGVNAATGGYIRGPGTATSDSIPARLSNGEFVLRASAVRRLGVGFLSALNEVGSSGVSGRRIARGYADGGMVTAGGGSDSSHSLDVGLEDGLVLRHMESSEGQRTMVRIIERNATKINRALGR